VNRVDQVSGDPELVGRGLFYSDTANGRRIPQVGLGIGIDGSSASYRTAPPRLGEHTHDVLREVLGYDDAAIASLREQKAI
jgi:crotonobetainyl-CoA:carnitine CoA-transferase CaiB-like acyl-CoA transferase